jgi:3-phenylpropionate/trans-cinnamate dioxygenase ferredoxin component
MTAHVVARLDALAPCSVQRFEVEGHPIAVVRIDDEVYAIGDICSHAHISLSEGELYCDTKEIECWKHGSTFSLETGEPQTLPATQPVPVYKASVVDGNIVIEVSDSTEQAPSEEAAS